VAAGADFGADGEAVNSVRGRGANMNRLGVGSCPGPSGQAEPADYLPACFFCFALSAAGTVPPWGLISIAQKIQTVIWRVAASASEW